MSDQRKAVIKNADMEDKMQQDAVDIASKALSEYNIEKVRWSVVRRRRANDMHSWNLQLTCVCVLAICLVLLLRCNDRM
jgi:Dynein light chain type 1